MHLNITMKIECHQNFTIQFIFIQIALNLSKIYDRYVSLRSKSYSWCMNVRAIMQFLSFWQ
jgi:hypothetical protein